MDILRFGISIFFALSIVGCIRIDSKAPFSHPSPYLVNSLNEKYEKLYIGQSSISANYSFRGLCFQNSGKLTAQIFSSDRLSIDTVQVECIDGEYQFEKDTLSWEEGAYSIISTSTTIHGITSQTESIHIIDLTPPSLGSVNPVESVITSNSPNPFSVSGTCSQGDLPVEVYVNGVFIGFFPCIGSQYTGFFDFELFPEGNVEILIVQKDLAGNTSEQRINIFKDTLAPANKIQISLPTPYITNSNIEKTATFVLPSDATQYKVLRIFNSNCDAHFDELTALSPQTSPNYTLELDLGDGIYSLCLIAGDQYGNFQSMSQLSKSNDIILDQVAPELTITSPSEGQKQPSQATVKGTCESGTSVQLQGAIVNSPQSTICKDSIYELSATLAGNDGAKNLKVVSTDAATNSTEINFSVIKDTVLIKPLWTLQSRLNKEDFAKFNISTCDDATKVFVSESGFMPPISDPEWQDCSTDRDYIYDLSGGENGSRAIYAFFVDEVGNYASIETFVLYDTKPPTITISSVPQYLPESIPYLLTFRVTEADISPSTLFYVELFNGSAWVNAGSQALNKISPLAAEKIFYSWTPTHIGAQQKLRITLTDNSGQTSTVESNEFEVLKDVTPPEVIFESYKINGSTNPLPSYSKVINIEFHAQDTQTDITHYCLKSNSASKPTNSDNCWVALETFGITPDREIQTDIVKFDLIIPDTHQMYLWVRDRGLNISDHMIPIAIGKDLVTLQYFIDAPPNVDSFIAANKPDPQLPPSWVDLTANLGTDIHLFWNASDNKGISKVQLLLSVEDGKFEVVQEDLINDANGDCVLTSEFTGCAVWSSTVPLAKSFALQIRVVDEYGQASSLRSALFNAGDFRLLAGNLDSGDGSDPRLTRLSPSYNSNSAGVGQVVTLTNGMILINDTRGLVRIDPLTFSTQVILKASDNSTPSGDGGPVEEARAGSIIKFTVDFLDNIWIQDINRIRKIDTHTSPWTITSVIGANNEGQLGESTADIVLDPRNFKMNIQISSPYTYNSLVFIPNGDLYFRGDATDSTSIKVYRGSLPNPRIETIRLSGGLTWPDTYSANTASMPFHNWSVQFDPITGNATSMIVLLGRPVVGNTHGYPAKFSPTGVAQSALPSPYGNISLVYNIANSMDNETYFYNRFTHNRLLKLNKASNTWSAVAGNDVHGTSPDNSVASTSAVLLDTVFVNRFSSIYLMEEGIFRVIKNNRIYSLYGSHKNSPDNAKLDNIKFNNITSIDHGPGAKVIAYDDANHKFTEIIPNNLSQQSRHLAGNGSYTGYMQVGGDARSQGITMAGNLSTPIFTSDSDNGDIYFGCRLGENDSRVCRLINSTHQWTALPASAPGSYPNFSDTSSGYLNSYQFAYAAMPGAFGKFASTKKILISGMTFVPEWNNMQVSTKEMTNFPGASSYVRHTIGNGGPNTNIDFVDGALGINTPLWGYGLGSSPKAQFDSTSDSWIVTGSSSFGKVGNAPTTLYRIKAGGSFQKVAFLDHPSNSFYVYKDYVYSCANTGELMRTYSIGPSVSERLPMPAGFRCNGYAMLFKPADSLLPDRLVFPVIYNGCQGIGEYKLE